jgi:hypothetical protein
LVKEEVKAVGLMRNPKQWQAWKKGTPGHEAPDKHLIAAHIARLNGIFERHTRKAAAQAQPPQRSQFAGSSPFHDERRNTT